MEQTMTLNFKVVDNVKRKATSTLIVNLLKKFDIPGSQAVRMFHQNGHEYIVRKCYLLEYQIYIKKPIGDKKRWLMACINNDWNESDAFKAWYKDKKEYIINNGNDDLRQLLSV